METAQRKRVNICSVMDSEQLYEHLEALAEQLGITIRYENLSDSEAYSRSGLCKVKGCHYYIMDRSKRLSEKSQMFI